MMSICRIVVDGCCQDVVLVVTTRTRQRMWSFQKLLEPLNSFVDSLLEDDDAAAKHARKTLGGYLFLQKDTSIPVKGDQPSLALLCLHILNHELSHPIAGTGFIKEPNRPMLAIPAVEIDLPADIWYACRFWCFHLASVGPNPSNELMLALKRFIVKRMKTWIEVMTSRGQFTRLHDVREWHERSQVKDEVIRNALYEWKIAFRFHSLANMLSESEHRQAALDAELEAVEIWRDLALRKPDNPQYEEHLAMSLSGLARLLSDIDRIAEAVPPSKEAVEIGQRLANMNPPALPLVLLAQFQYELSNYLANQHIVNESLIAAERAVDILRQNRNDESTKSTKYFISGLSALSHALYKITKAHIRQSPVIFLPYLLDTLDNLYRRLATLGRISEALEAVNELISIQKLPTTRCSSVSRLEALRDCASYLSDLGRSADAVAVAKECVDLARDFAFDSPEELIQSLNTYAGIAGLTPRLALKSSDEAIFLAQEDPSLLEGCLRTRMTISTDSIEAIRFGNRSIDILRSLVSNDPSPVNMFRLGNVMLSVAARLDKMERYTESIAMLTEVVSMLRPSSLNPNNQFLRPVLARALYLISLSFTFLKCYEDAIPALQETIPLCRELSQGPYTGKPLLVDGLSLRRIIQIRTKQWKLALEDAEETLDLLRTNTPELIDKEVAVSLVGTLDSYSDLLIIHGQRKKAKGVVEEAASLIQRFKERWPTEFDRMAARLRLYQLRHELHVEETLDEIRGITATLEKLEDDAARREILHSVQMEVKCLAALGKREEALVAAEASLVICQKLPKDDGASTPDEVVCWRDVSSALSHLGRRNEAMDAIEMAPKYSSGEINRSAASSLSSYALRLAAVGRKDEALTKAESAVQIFRELAVDQKEADFREETCLALHNLSNRLYELDRKEDALSAAQQATSLYRAAIANSGDFEHLHIPFVLALSDLGRLLGDLGRNREALGVINEGLDLLRRSSRCSPSKRVEVQAQCSNQLALRLHALGQLSEAVVEAHKSVELYRNLSATYPAAFNNLLAESLSTLHDCTGELEVIQEAVRLLGPMAERWPLVFNRDLAKCQQKLSGTPENLGPIRCKVMMFV
ncbi:hypothetical protein C8R43DRAFT_455164 [Mycena crocata]|nr:hypothetical protein C8R43DRAFT_455164 [Mycena crocata]